MIARDQIVQRFGALLSATLTSQKQLVTHVDALVTYWHGSHKKWNASAYTAVFSGLGKVALSKPEARPFIVRALQPMEQHIVWAMPKMNAQDLGSFLRGLAQCRFLSSKVLDAWDNRCSEIWFELEWKHALNALIALGDILGSQLQSVDWLWWLFVQYAHLVQVRELTHVAYSAAILGCERDDVIEKIGRQFHRHYGRNCSYAISAANAIKLLWSLAILRIRVTQTLVNRFMGCISQGPLSSADLTALHQAVTLLDLTVPPGVKQHIDHMLSNHRNKHGTISTHMEEEIVDILTELGLTSNKQWTYDGYVDDEAIAESRSVYPILFEFTGEKNHFLEAEVARARTRARRRMTKARGVISIEIPAGLWQQLSYDQKRQFIANKVF